MTLPMTVDSTQSFIEGPPATRLLHSPEDAVSLIETCFEHQVQSVLLYAENLTAQFFDLSSGEAGTILQKFRNYRIKVAVVVSPGEVQQSTNFRTMMIEESQGGDFRLFADRDAAAAWLLRE